MPMGDSAITNRSTTSRVTDLKLIAKREILKDFLARHPSVKYLRLQWLNHTATGRLRL